ncbi:MAG: hypothetical protein M1821_001871 [Bathelium mastoideum]|nr:MAG: hypothetical protein M1821_001871 [Bathelium mastoideum]
MSEKRKIIVVGAGIGGKLYAVLSTAVTVYERDAEVSEIGAGIQVTPNFARILGRWGLAERLDQVAVKPGWLRQRRWQNGDILSQGQVNADNHMLKLHGVPYYHIHRADLQALLLVRSKELGVTCKTSAHVVGYAHDNGEEKVVFVDGSSAKADLVIAADGLRSSLAKEVLGHEVPNESIGDSAYRGLIPREQMQEPELKTLNLEYNTDVWMGPNSHAVTYYVRDGELFNFVVALPDDPGEESWKAPGDMEKLRKHFEGWDPRIRTIVSKIKQSYVWKLRDRPALERWVHPIGKLVLLGDAAHAMLPYVAQGASSSVEDAAALAECLDFVKPGTRDFRAVLEAYEKIRKPRALHMKNSARSNRIQFHMPDGPEQQARDEAMRNESRDGPSSNMWKDQDKLKVLYGHDVVKEVQEYFQLGARL